MLSFSKRKHFQSYQNCYAFVKNKIKQNKIVNKNKTDNKKSTKIRQEFI